MPSISVIHIYTTNYCTSIYDIFLATSGLTGTQDWLLVMVEDISKWQQNAVIKDTPVCKIEVDG